MYQQLKRWAERRHPNKSKSWVAKKYWHTHKLRNWVFSTRDGSLNRTHDKGFIGGELCEVEIFMHSSEDESGQ